MLRERAALKGGKAEEFSGSLLPLTQAVCDLFYAVHGLAGCLPVPDVGSDREK